MRGGQIVREARRRAGLTQAELARRLGTTQPVVARWEANSVSPTVETLDRIVRACGFYLDIRLLPLEEVEQDWSLIRENLALSPEERLAKLEAFVDFAQAGNLALRQAQRG